MNAGCRSGADVNFMEDRLSALHIAACKGQTDIAKLLINNKCNVNILTRFSNLILDRKRNFLTKFVEIDYSLICSAISSNFNLM